MMKLALLLSLPVMAFAYSSGPPDNHTSSPNCTACHSSYPLNSGAGELLVDVPEFFVPGETYPVTVTLQYPGKSRWGFEASNSGGDFQLTDPVNTQLSISGGNDYVKQTSAGTYNGTGDGPVSWSFDWTAPADETFVTFRAAGNAANGNGSTSGDHIYTVAFYSELALPPVSDLSIVHSGSAVELSWTMPDVALELEARIERKTLDEGWEWIDTSSGDSYTDVAPGELALYRVILTLEVDD